MLQIASLGSGSSGNATIIRSATTTLLLDCGFTLREITRRLSLLGVKPENIDAILITHEHGDHVKGVGPFSRKYAPPVWVTPGTWKAMRDRKIPDVQFFHAHAGFRIGDIELDPFPTPHDAAESCQFVFSHGEHRIGCLTDLGVPTVHVTEKMAGVDLLLLETNYDVDMLRDGPYPPSLQARIASNWGHLANSQAGELLRQLDHERLQCVLLGHLSEKNNTPAVARETVARYMKDGDSRLQVLAQDGCSEWIDLK